MWEGKNYWKVMKQRGLPDHNKTHTHIQTVSSHWQLRLSHWPHTQYSSWPLWWHLIMQNTANITQWQIFHNSTTRNLLYAGFKNGWITYNNKWLEILSKIARAYKTMLSLIRILLCFMNEQL